MTYRETAGVEEPWGSWLTLDKNGYFVDSDGRSYPTIRDCFWHSRLRMVGRLDRWKLEEVLELVLAVLLALASGRRSANEIAMDLFGHNRMFRRFVGEWLLAERLIEANPGQGADAVRLTSEGAAVMRMLMITRPIEVTEYSIGPITLAAIRELDRVVGPAGSRMSAAEDAARTMDAAFVRDDRRDDLSVVLLRRDAEGPIPLVRTIWALDFETEADRNRFYAWMCDRMDRWPAWSEMAWKNGAPRLTSHLLRLLAADLVGNDNAAEPQV